MNVLDKLDCYMYIPYENLLLFSGDLMRQMSTSRYTGLGTNCALYFELPKM